MVSLISAIFRTIQGPGPLGPVFGPGKRPVRPVLVLDRLCSTLCLPGPPAQPPPPVLLASITNMTQCAAYYGRCRVRTNWLNGPLPSPLLETTGDYV